MEYLDLDLPVSKLKGVGEKTEKELALAGVKNIRDLLYQIPRGYGDVEKFSTINQIKPGNVQIVGRVTKINNRSARSRKMSIVEAVIEDETGAIRAVWFNQSYRVKQFLPDKLYLFSGKYELKNGRFQLMSPSAIEFNNIKKDELKADSAKALIPVYVAKAGIKSMRWQKILEGLKSEFFLIPDLLPTEIGVKAGTRGRALYNVHFPKDEKTLAIAKKYLSFEELFGVMLASRINNQKQKIIKAEAMKFVAENTKKIVEKLPFKLTKSQRLAVWEILEDLGKDIPMNRLLQGDVGSGKTVVAGIAIAQVVMAGGQVAVLAPTAILASQHQLSLMKILEPLGIEVVLLTSASKNKKRIKADILSGKINVVVGTHALLTDDTKFSRLRFCVVDEQHRFGVEQRQKLLMKAVDGKSSHMLMMTATPIPRSLQLTIFGDVKVSTLSEKPENREIVETKIIKEYQLAEVVYKEIRARVSNGEQVYVICKMIDNEEERSVEREVKLMKKEFENYKIVALHGKMSSQEKDNIMTEYASGRIQILISTTVVEVGVNVPNATMIVILDAQKYGLAQLHQLRGRVGRGEKASACYLVDSSESGIVRRLKLIHETDDGFKLAELDLAERGPGEIYGSLQHGVMDLKIANFTDTAMIRQVDLAVDKFLQSKPDMLKYKELAILLQKYQQLTILN